MTAQILPLQGDFPAHELLRNPDAMRVILDAADIPINYCSADRKFLFVNRTYAAWYGKTPEEIIGKSLVDLLGEEGHETIRPYYERALKGEHFSYETEVNLSNGYKYIQCKYTPIFDETGKVTGWVGIIYDMTQRYLLEKTLHENEAALTLAKEKAEAANIAKSEFMANMSHEIRTPMNAVVGLSHLLSKSIPLTGKQKEMINTLQLSAQSLLSLINDLLDFSKIESNGIDLEHIPYNFSSIIEDVTAMFAAEAEIKGIYIDYKRSPEDERYYMGDPLRVRQIVTNLIGNALKFTHRGGVSIRIQTGPCSTPNSQFVHVHVKDTGIGIPSHKTAAVFDKFMQADMSITRQYGGSGLGLAISKNLAELMGGSITLNSVLGEGSEFILHLPLECADTSLTEIPEEKEVLPSGLENIQLQVLLVEDHAPNIMVAMQLFESMGHRCDVANNGREALEKLNADITYDIIFMDIQMPEMDGYVAIRFIREMERITGKSRTPIIVISAHVSGEDIQKCYNAGADDFISKPFNAERLKQKMAILLGNMRSCSAIL